MLLIGGGTAGRRHKEEEEEGRTGRSGEEATRTMGNKQTTTTTTASPPPRPPKKEGDNDKKETTTTEPPSSSPQQQNEEPDVCCICLDELSFGHKDAENVRATCCGKQWHSDCQNKVQNSIMPDNLKYRCHQCRKPFPVTDEEHIKQLREWLDKDKAWAQNRMGQWYRNGEYGVKQSHVMAVLLLEKAAKQGDLGAMFNLGCMYNEGDDSVQSYTKAFELFTMAAEQGHVKAMVNLGIAYMRGKGVAKSLELAREWFAKAAQEGKEEKAIIFLRMLDLPEGNSTTTCTPPTNAVEMHTQTVGQGDVNAMFKLAWMYEQGKGVDQSFQKAAELFTMAAEKGHVNAMFSLGFLYTTGNGVAQSDELARAWWTKAANEGNIKAIAFLKALDINKGQSTNAPTILASPLPSICCSSCNKPQPSGFIFPKCKGCRTVQYCNTDCQRAHWSPGGHKQVCKRLRQKKKGKKGSSSSQNKNQKSK